jgi:hypothetical protein
MARKSMRKLNKMRQIMTSQTVKGTKGKWAINFKNIGKCSHYKHKVCELSGESCPEKGIRDYNIILKGLYNRYGELDKNGQVKIANKDKKDVLPQDVRYAISDLAYKKWGM